MIKDVPKTVKQVADFLGVKLTASELAVCAERSSFAWMKQYHHLFDGGVGTPLAAGEGTMIRQGAATGGAELTPAQRDAIDAAMLRQFKSLGSDFPYAERYMKKKQ